VQWTDRVIENEEIGPARLESVANCQIVRCDFRGAKLSELTTQATTFEECNFGGANLSSSKHRGTSFLNCDFTGGDLFGADLEHCRLVGSVFENAVLAAAKISGGDWSYTALRMQELDEFDMREMKLEGADLYGCSLIKADLRDAILTKANLQHAKLTKADLRGAEISGIDFRTVDLKGVRMSTEQALMFAMSYGIILE
jgi:fluoroquinolone resistance protein